MIKYKLQTYNWDVTEIDAPSPNAVAVRMTTIAIPDDEPMVAILWSVFEEDENEDLCNSAWCECDDCVTEEDSWEPPPEVQTRREELITCIRKVLGFIEDECKPPEPEGCDCRCKEDEEESDEDLFSSCSSGPTEDQLKKALNDLFDYAFGQNTPLCAAIDARDVLEKATKIEILEALAPSGDDKSLMEMYGRIKGGVYEQVEKALRIVEERSS